MKKNYCISRWNLFIIPFILFFMTACRSVPVSGRRQLLLLPESQIVEESARQYKAFVNEAPKSKDPKKIAFVEKVCKRVASAADRFLAENKISDVKMNWEFTLISDSRINAFCMPGGKIVIFTGILPLCDTEDELATVVSHEVSHALARHSNERISQEVLRQLGGSVLSLAVSNRGGVTRKVIGQAYGLGSKYLVTLPYSRSHEHEADIMGLTIMSMAGYNPQKAITFWEKMAQKGSKVPEIMSTHPSDANRIKKIREKIPDVMPIYESNKKRK